MRDDLDRFYTKPEIAESLLKMVDLTGFRVVEPSAGSGSFSNLIDCIAYDLQPQQDNIIQKNWFDVTQEDLYDHDSSGAGEALKPLALIGNPPFGKRSTLAKKFITHGINLGATKIGFILPKIFNKFLTQKVFPATWSLTSSIDLGDNCFIFEGEDEHIPCVFQVWEHDPEQVLNNLRLAPPPKITDFKFLPRQHPDADFCVNGNNGKVKPVSDVTNPKSEHYIKIGDGSSLDEVKTRLSNIVWDFHSSCSGGVAWIGQDEIARKYVTTNM